jgi:xylulokinase
MGRQGMALGLIGLDCGTQSIRALLIDAGGRTLALAARPTPTIARASDQAEHAPEALWETVLALLAEIATAREGIEIAGIACASMGEACVLLDAAARPLGTAVPGFAGGSEPDAATLAATIGAERLFAITGMPVDPTLTLCKLLWHRRSDPAQFARVRRVLNLADYIAFRLSGAAATDRSLASRTLLLDIGAGDWSAELAARVGIDPALLPPVRPSGTCLGPVRAEVLAATGIGGRPVVGVGGHDHVIGGFAAGAARPGILLDSIGTAEALLQTVDRPVLTAASSARGFWQGAVALDRAFAYVGAGINRAGGAIEWLAGLLGSPPREALIAAAGAVPAGSSGVLFLPHLAYATAPVVDTASRGAFLGLTAATDAGTLFRAVLEGLAMEARLAVDALAALPGAGTAEDIRVIGGGARNALLLAIKAACYARPLTVIEAPEATALGAALLGGIAAGLFADMAAAHTAIRLPMHAVEPEPAAVDAYARLFADIYRRTYPTLAPLSHALATFGAAGAGTERK